MNINNALNIWGPKRFEGICELLLCFKGIGEKVTSHKAFFPSNLIFISV